MNVLEALVGALIGAVVGYLVAKGKGNTRGIPAPHFFTIHVTKDNNGNYSSQTTPKSERVKGSDVLVWHVKDNGNNALPAGSTVKLKFTAGSPTDPSEPNDGGTRTIFANVKTGQPVTNYPYKVYYVVGGTEHLLEDPELIMEN